MMIIGHLHTSAVYCSAGKKNEFMNGVAKWSELEKALGELTQT